MVVGAKASVPPSQSHCMPETTSGVYRHTQGRETGQSSVAELKTNLGIFGRSQEAPDCILHYVTQRHRGLL